MLHYGSLSALAGYRQTERQTGRQTRTVMRDYQINSTLGLLL